MQTLSRAIIYLEEHNIRTINDLAVLLNNTSGKINEMNAAKRTKEQRIRDIDAIFAADKTIRELGPILEKYNGIFFKNAKEKYGREHADEIEKVKKAQRLLYKLKITLPIDRKALKAESSRLQGEVESMLPELEAVKAEMEQLLSFRAQVRKVLPEALSVKYEGGKKSFEDVSEEVQNQKELRQLLDQSADRAIRYGEEQQRRKKVQHRQQQTQQNVTH